jgi:eukaryotic-like serine/threonine-protein kinase
VPGDGEGELRDRTLDEARASAAVQSPHVVPVYDVVEDGGALWVVMEFLQAQSLEQVVARDGALSPESVAEIGLGVLEALQAVHAAGLIHRDVKPGNVLLAEDGRVLLADFGIATSGDAATGGAGGADGGVVVGSPAYLAPERTRGARGSRAADLWGLGATLATAVEGRAVFQREGAVPTLLAVLHDEPDLTYAGPLAPVLRGLLEKDPPQRWDASRAREELLRVRAGAVPRQRGEHAGRLALPSAAVLVAIVAAGLVAASPSGTPGAAGGDRPATTHSPEARVTAPASRTVSSAAASRVPAAGSTRSGASGSASRGAAVASSSPATHSVSATSRPTTASASSSPAASVPPHLVRAPAGGQGQSRTVPGPGDARGKGHASANGKGHGHGSASGKSHGNATGKSHASASGKGHGGDAETASAQGGSGQSFHGNDA